MGSPPMDSICYDGCNCILALLKHHKEMLFGLSVIHSHCELIEQLGNSLCVDVFEATVQHQVHQIVHYLPVLPQVEESLKALGLENLEITVLQSSHCLDHVLPDLYGRRVRLGIPSQDEPEVNVKHLPRRGNK